MCGICGVACTDLEMVPSTVRIEAMCDAMQHRGPDDAGVTVEPGIGLGSRRLSIQDLSAHGHMPMTSNDGRYEITYNGEVYNFAALRRELVHHGYEFHTGTDTEVVLNLFAHEGPAMLNRLNGMFAIAIWDRKEKSLFLARDRLGVKPLYYARHQADLCFASEPKSLSAAGVPIEFDHSCWAELLSFRYVAGERTPFIGILALLPGTYLWWRAGELTITRWWKLADRILARRASLPRDEVGWFRKTFDDSVALRKIADVPVGVMLSGGLDSGSVAAALGEMTGPGIHGFTVTFDETTYDEGPLARQVADRWGMIQHEISVPRRELLPRLRQASRLLDAPLAHTNDAHMLALSELARSNVKVLLSGEGADETLNGYVRYQPLRFPKLLRAAATSTAKQLLQRVGQGRVTKFTRMLDQSGVDGLVEFNACDVFPSELEQVGLTSEVDNEFRASIMNEARTCYPNDLLRQAMYLDQHTFLVSLLDRNDRMTMGASIECRVPFLDYRIVETLAALPTDTLLKSGKRKAILRRSVGDRLPLGVLRAKKWGFGIPWNLYLREEMSLRYEVERLPRCAAIVDGPLDRKKVEALVQRFLAGDDSALALVKSLLMISIWYDEMKAMG